MDSSTWGFVQMCSWVDIIKLIVACLLGGMIGWEREVSRHPAGLRTHILVSLGATCFLLLAYSAKTMTPDGLAVNPGRIMQGVITGMGFIGAGAIMKSGFSIHGLTTAASLWMASAVGLLVGIGAIPLAFVATLVSVAALILSRHRGNENGSANADATPAVEGP